MRKILTMIKEGKMKKERQKRENWIQYDDNKVNKNKKNSE